MKSRLTEKIVGLALIVSGVVSLASFLIILAGRLFATRGGSRVAPMPMRLIALNLFLGAACAFVGYILLAAKPKASGLCANCGYDLTGNLSGVCPECGEQAGQNEI